MSEERIVRNLDQYRDELAERKKLSDAGKVRTQCVQKDVSVSHKQVANLTIKIIHGSNVEPFVKKVMTIKISAPLVTGRAISNQAIAIQCGASVRDVDQAIEYGLEVIRRAIRESAFMDNAQRVDMDSLAKKTIRESQAGIKPSE